MSIKTRYIVENDAQLSGAIVRQIQILTTAAFAQWGKVLAGNADIAVKLVFADEDGGRADGTAMPVAAGVANGVTVWEPAAAYELRTGQDTGLDWDVQLTFSADYINDELYLGAGPNPGTVPSNRTDALSIIVHEIGHALGFIGYWEDRAETPMVYDGQVFEQDGALYFAGPNTAAVYAGAVPLTDGNYVHYGNSDAGPGDGDPLTGLMNGMAFYRGHRYPIGALDLAFLADMGLGTIGDDIFDLPYMDKFTGGAGDDTYHVYDAATEIVESVNRGADAVVSTVSYTLPNNVEALTLIGEAAIDGTGNRSSNLITGNAAANHLMGGDRDDTLIGGTGADTLDGGSGNDRMHGGEGDDVYIVNSAGDVVAEAESRRSGVDTVQSSVIYQLGANLENLTLTGRNGISGTGNALGNIITGNAGGNRLTGGAGDDSLIGGAGRDILIGGRGDDVFVFGPEDFAGKTAATADRITDFARGDLVDLSALGTDRPLDWIGSAAFTGAGGELRYAFAGSATLVSGDLDGDRAADFVLRIDGRLPLIETEFIL